MKLNNRTFTRTLIAFIIGLIDCRSGATSSELVGWHQESACAAVNHATLAITVRSNGSYSKPLTGRGHYAV